VPVILSYVVCVLLGLLIILQASLIVGTPLGRFAWGGNWDVLPARERGFAALTIIGYALAGFVVLEGSGVLAYFPALASEIAAFVFAAVFFGGFALTATSRGPWERRLMLPTNLALSALFLIVAVTGHISK
jgi:hypothetical protein